MTLKSENKALHMGVKILQRGTSLLDWPFIWGGETQLMELFSLALCCEKNSLCQLMAFYLGGETQLMELWNQSCWMLTATSQQSLYQLLVSSYKTIKWCIIQPTMKLISIKFYQQFPLQCHFSPPIWMSRTQRIGLLASFCIWQLVLFMNNV